MYQKYTDFGRQKGIVTLTPNTVDALTNEEQVKKIQALERGAAESTRLIENLWVQNCGLVKTIVHNVTGLNAGEPGFDDMEQQSFFGFHAAIYTTPQTLYNWKEAAFRSIRTGKYGKALAEFSSSESGKRRADSLIKQDLNALKRLELSNKEKELLAL